METITVDSKVRQSFKDITSNVQEIVSNSGVKDGICVVFTPHTTAGITINENADPDVRKDLKSILRHVIPDEKGYLHQEGNSAAHAKSSLIGCSETIIINDGKLVLGTWQAIFFCDFDGPRTGRKIHIKVIGS